MPPNLKKSAKLLGFMMILHRFEGLSPEMIVALGEAGIKSLEDFADCATDDLTGWNERKDGQTVKHKGALHGSRCYSAQKRGLDHAGARIALGWIEAPVEE